MSRILATDFANAGHEVRLITHTSSADNDHYPFEVIRTPTARKLMSSVKWSDVVFHNNVCLRFAWPQLVIRRPWVIANHTWIRRADMKFSMQDRLKLLSMRFARHISVSQAIADHLPFKSVVIGNSYDDSQFRIIPTIERKRDFVYFGRLVSDKGVGLAIKAIKTLIELGLSAHLTIIGDGPDRDDLKSLAFDLGISEHIDFKGILISNELVEELNRHSFALIPSTWEEPFGLTAIESIACGCIPVGSKLGGLSEAIGKAGLTFQNGDLGELTKYLRELLSSQTFAESFLSNSESHLAKFNRSTVTQKYLNVIEAAAK